MSRHMKNKQVQNFWCQPPTTDQWKEGEARRLSRDRMLQASLKEDEGMDRRKYLKQAHQEYEDRSLKCALYEAEQARLCREKLVEQEQRMAEELARIEYEKEKDARMRQHIRENSLEFKELESKLMHAYLNKERAAQIAEQEAKRCETMREEANYTRKLKQDYEKTLAEEQRLEEKRHENMLQYQNELEQQLLEKEHQRQKAYEEFLKEKLLVDEIVKKIYEEDLLERQRKMEKVKTTQQHIEEFKRQQAEWRRMEQENMEAENRRIMEFAAQQQHKEEDRVIKMKQREEAKDKLYQRLRDLMDKEREEREELERVREEYFMEEQEEANRRKDFEEMEKKIKSRMMMWQTCQEQLAFKEMQKQAAKDEEDAFRRMMMNKFVEDDRIEQMNAQKRRMKQLEHKRAVEKILEERRQERIANVEMEAREKALEEEGKAMYRKIVEEERQKLLQCHAKRLLGYYPKGLLRQDDLQLFDEDFRKNFEPRHVDSSSEDGC